MFISPLLGDLEWERDHCRGLRPHWHTTYTRNIVTEIPEHLLKRSKERREAASGGASSDSGASTPATTSSAPAIAKPTAPVVASAPAPKPDPSYVVAAKTRKKIPFWAMATSSPRNPDHQPASSVSRQTAPSRKWWRCSTPREIASV